jgi:hypothetical protein
MSRDGASFQKRVGVRFIDVKDVSRSERDSLAKKSAKKSGSKASD